MQNSKIAQRIVKPDTSIVEAMKLMDDKRVKLLIVADNYDFLGLVTIGDIQRAIIKNLSFETKIAELIREDILVAKEGDPQKDIEQIMLKYRLECMPVINNNNMLIDVILWEDLFKDEIDAYKKQINIPVAIMAGGKGTRLKPLTNVIPKPLVPLGEKPILEHIIDRFVRLGCNQFELSVNYKAEMIQFYLDRLENKKYTVDYHQETMPLGTAGSLFLLKNKINSTFFVTNCDILIEQDYSEIYDYHVNNKNHITIVASVKHFEIPYGIVETSDNGQLLELKEKPTHTYLINSGMYILEPEVLEYIPENEFYNITSLIEAIKNDGHNVGVFPVSDKSWIDIGEWPEYAKALELSGDQINL